MSKRNHWYDYLWVLTALYLALGFFNILFAWLGLLCFFIPLIISVTQGTKGYCNRYCGRGQLFGLLGGFWLDREQSQLADRVIRFHVIANSDTEADQALKLRVRDRILEEAAGYLQLAAAPAEGLTRLLSPTRMQLLYSSLQVQPDGAPAALLLTEECTRLTVAVQLLPPFVWEDPLPPLPDVPAALTLQLTMQDVVAIDTAPAALAQKLVHSTDGKCWLHHPKAETFLSERLALLQRVYK